MTSKEKIEYLEQLYHSKRRSGNTSVKEYNTIEEIINDLEALDILKKYVYFDARTNAFYFRKGQDFSEYKLLKEWLNGKD